MASNIIFLYHRIYDRITNKQYNKLNSGLNILHNTWGFGCPQQVVFITLDELKSNPIKPKQLTNTCNEMMRYVRYKRFLWIRRFVRKIQKCHCYKNDSICNQYNPPKVESINIRVICYKTKIIKKYI